ncbi:MAG TPA: 5-oxoprolinase subunit PxpB [Xanthobacteraceae bacterium]
MDPRFLPAGDTALVVEFGAEIERTLSERVLQLAEQIRSATLAGVIETVPTFRSLLVHYDPLTTSGAQLAAGIRALGRGTGTSTRRRRLWRLPACYAAACAPDLAAVAERTGLHAADVIERHARTRFHVYMIGFVPGYPYMGDLPSELHLPRRADPRTRVPAGSIAIASSLTAVYPIESPGGWHLIGATPVRMFDPSWQNPSLLAPGDAVLFEPVTFDEYQSIHAAIAAGRYTFLSEEIDA